MGLLTFCLIMRVTESFFLCRLNQNVVSGAKSRKFKLNWLSLETPPSTYKLDYVDKADMDSILTNVEMERVARDTFKLSKVGVYVIQADILGKSSFVFLSCHYIQSFSLTECIVIVGVGKCRFVCLSVCVFVCSRQYG